MGSAAAQISIDMVAGSLTNAIPMGYPYYTYAIRMPLLCPAMSMDTTRSCTMPAHVLTDTQRGAHRRCRGDRVVKAQQESRNAHTSKQSRSEQQRRRPREGATPKFSPAPPDYRALKFSRFSNMGCRLDKKALSVPLGK